MKTQSFISILLITCLLMMSNTPLKAQFSGSGSGTSGDPYIITTPEQLNQVRNNLTAHYKLGNDIDLDAYLLSNYNHIGWEPIGTWSYDLALSAFKGTFNGNGHKISGMWISRNANDLGLFGYMNGAHVENVGIEILAGISGASNIGGLAGVSENSTIESCYATGVVIGTGNVGGLVGLISGNTSTIENCYATGSVTGISDYLGGLVGRSIGVSYITNCYATVAIYPGTSGTYHGSFIGEGYAASITNCFFNNTISTLSGRGDGIIWGVTGKSTADMKQQHTFASWDFSAIWRICPSVTYPYLAWQTGISCTNPFCGGTGTSTDPYQICTPEQLDKIRNYLGAHFILKNDINLTTYLSSGNPGYNSGAGWVPIGVWGDISTIAISAFTGSFDGGGHKITGLRMNRPSTNDVGLFGYMYGAHIENLGVEIATAGVTGAASVGGLAGVSDRNSSINNCYATGKVDGTDQVGGLVGRSDNSSAINYCYATGNVTGTNYIGGLVGRSDNNSSINYCYATANVTGTADRVGGLAGYHYSSLAANFINRCYATGEVTGRDYVGGLLGETIAGSLITNCYATGEVTGRANVGGLIGRSYGLITNCYATGRITGTSYVGGLIGYNNTVSNAITNCFFNTDTAGAIPGLGYSSSMVNTVIGKSTAEMKQIATFTTNISPNGWDFTTPVWKICENEIYPYLAWQPEVTCIATYYCGGTGIPTEPFLICSPEQLDRVRYYPDKYFKLENDINLTAYLASGTGFSQWGAEGWLPIGLGVNSFSGNFNGAGHKITGLWIERSTGQIGLFGALAGGTIDSLGVEITAKGVSGNTYVGGLAGVATSNSTIERCYVTGNITGTGDNIGGLVGRSQFSSIKNCYAAGNVSGSAYVGGLVGDINESTDSITNCYAKGSVSGTTSFGGLAGQNRGSIANCFFDADMAGSIPGIGSGTTTGVTPKTTAEMKQIATFTTNISPNDWNFIDGIGAWAICEGASYPYFQWQTGIVANTIVLTSATNSHHQTLCANNTALTNVTYSTTGATGATISGLPTGVTGNWLNNVVTISGTPTVAGTYTYMVRLTGGCGNKTATGTITVKDIPDIAAIPATVAIPNGGSLTMPAPAITINGSAISAQGWEMETGVGSGTFSNIALPYPISSGDDGKKLRYYATNECGSATSNEITITVYTLTFCGGTGEYADPFLICNVEQLDNVRYLLNKHYKLANDIDLTNYLATGNGFVQWGAEGWLPIGTYPDNSFSGTLNGAGHKITGLWINRPNTDYVGLFGYNEGATIDNVGIAIAAADSVKGKGRVGGLVGLNYQSSIIRCYVTGEVKGSQGVGGLAGYNFYGSIANSYATGNVSGRYNSIGGLAGDNSGSIINCYATGAVKGINFIGGLVGGSDSPVTNCYATGLVNGGAGYSGALLGSNRSTITNCFYDNTVNGTLPGVANADNSGGTRINVVGRTPAQMKQQATYIPQGTAAGQWNFTSGTGVWAICEDVTYPYLQWQNMTCQDFGLIFDVQTEKFYLDINHNYTIAGAPEYVPTGATWDNGTLTLTNFAWKTNASCALNIIGVAGGNLTLKLAGTNAITSLYDGASPTHGIRCLTDGNLTIEGNGTLDVKSGNTTGLNNSYGMEVGANLILNDGMLTITAGSAAGTGYSTGLQISATGSLTINGGMLTAAGNQLTQGSTGITAYSDITINGGMLTAIGGNLNNTIGINTGNNVIYNGGSIKAQGTDRAVYFTSGTFTPTISAYQWTKSVNYNGSSPVTGKSPAEPFSVTDNPRYMKVEKIPPFCGGTGIPTDPFLICTAGQLDSVRYYLTSSFKLSNDINLFDYINNNYNTAGWEPIGNNTTPYIGTFNGAGYKITGLWINRPSTDYVGLFGYTFYATIDNFGVEIASANSVKGGNYVGGIVGYHHFSSITGCYVAGKVSGTANVGGLAGYHQSAVINNCYVAGDVSGTDNVGGLVGHHHSSSSSIAISRCYATGGVSGTNNVGKLVGLNNDLITRCYYNNTENSAIASIGLNNYSGGMSIYGISTAQMRLQATYYQWDFTGGTGIWKICEGITYPFFQWQTDIICMPPPPFCSGSGTDLDPYLICNAIQLDSVRHHLTSSFKLNNDITDLKNYIDNNYPAEGWLPIGDNATDSDASRFTGSFNGAGHKITGLWINRPTTDFVGLFGYTNQARLDSLGVEIDSEGVKGNNTVGGLVGRNTINATITNCYVTGNVSGTSYVGGFVGANFDHSTIRNCYATGNVDGTSYVGGLVGTNYLSSDLFNCYAIGGVTGSSNIGGLAGENNSSTITRSFFDNTINSTLNGVGTIVGGSVTVTGKSTVEMKKIATYTTAISPDDWDFTTPIWKMCNNQTYPYLAWQQEVTCTGALIIPDANGIVHVNKNVTTGNGSGSSWFNAAIELADALKASNLYNAVKADSIQQIWVAEGTYYPLYNAADGSSWTNGGRGNAFVLVKDVQIYGGFPETANDTDNASGGSLTVQQARDTREWDAYPAILSGDIGVLNNDSDNCYHVVISADDVGTACLDGFTITKGNAEGSGSITVNSLTIDTYSGGGLYICSAPILANLTISENTANNNGGGIYINMNSSPILTNLTISGNTANNNGGGIFNNNSSPTLTNINMSGNRAGNIGGGIYNTYSYSFSITNVTISGNKANAFGGGIFNNNSSSPIIRNSIVWGNSSTTDNNVCNLNSSAPTYSYSLVERNSGTGAAWDVDLGTDGGNNLACDANPLFVAPQSASAAPTSAGNYRLQPSSPALNAGSNAYYDTGATPNLSHITTDLDGNPRIVNATIDLGAYEEQTPADEFNFAPLTFTYNGAGQSPVVTAISGRTPSLEYKVKNANDATYIATQPVNAGSYTIKASLGFSGGYLALIDTADFVIYPKDVMVTATGGTSTYGDNPMNPGLTATGLATGETAATLTGLSNSFGISATTPAGTHVLNVAGTLTNTNYIITGRIDGVWTVNPRGVTVTATSGTSTYGDNPMNPGLTATGLATGETAATLTGLSNSFGISATTPAGTHVLNVAGTLTNTNYIITGRIDGVWTVNPRGVTVTATSGTSTYGDNPMNPGLTATGLATGETAATLTGLSNSFGISATTPAGTHVLNVAGTLTNTNYTITGKIDGVWTVNPKGITVTATGGTSTYGDNPMNPGFTATGLATGETAATLTGLSNSFGISATTPAGTHVLNVAGTLTNTNYTITGRIDGVWTVNPKGITVTATGGTSTYGDNPMNPGLTATGLATGETAATLTGLSNSFGISATTPAGTHVLNVAGTLTNTNYTITGRIDGVWTVNQRALTIRAVDETIDLGQTPALTYTIASGSLINGDALNGALSAPYSAVGTFTIAQGSLSAGSNYDITYISGVLTVRSINVSVSEIKVDGQTAERNGNNFSLQAECGNNQGVITVTVDQYATVSIDGVVQNSRTVNLTNYGDNSFIITVTAQNGNSQTYTLTVYKPFPFDQIVKMRWNNTLTVINNPANNGGFSFTSYKWFRNGQLITTDQSWSAGADGQPINPDDIFYVEVTAVGINGSIRSCESTIALRSLQVRAYPNPVSAGQSLQIEADVDEEVLQGAVIDIYNLTGARVAQYRVQGRLTSIPVNYATGMYIFVVTGNNGLKKDVKVVVQ